MSTSLGLFYTYFCHKIYAASTNGWIKKRKKKKKKMCQTVRNWLIVLLSRLSFHGLFFLFVPKAEIHPEKLISGGRRERRISIKKNEREWCPNRVRDYFDWF